MSGRFDDLFGIVKATHSVSLEEMEQAISEQASKRSINAVDDENPEWTEAMFSEAKTATELLPHLIECNNEAVEGFKRGWQEMLRGECYPIETLWDDIDLGT